MTDLQNSMWIAAARASKLGRWLSPRTAVEGRALAAIWRRRFVQRRDGKRPRAYRVAMLWGAST